MRTILVAFADMHAGNKYGLLNPETTLTEYDVEGNPVKDYHPQLTPIQEVYWEFFIEKIQEIKTFAKKDRIVAVCVGDLATGDKHPAKLVSAIPDDQIAIACANLLPLYTKLNPSAVRIYKGTGAHNFGFGSAELAITRSMKVLFPKTETEVFDHSLSTINGMLVDISHHGPSAGIRTWLKGNVARLYLQSLMQDDLNAAKQPPRLVLRAHVHEDVRVWVEMKGNNHRYESTLVILPPLCYIDDYARQKAQSPSRVSYGLYVFEIIDGELARTRPMVKIVDIRSREIL